MHFLFFQIGSLYKRLFSYPQKGINMSGVTDYNVYWEEKRGKQIGMLSEWQKERAHLILESMKNDIESITIGDIGCGDGSILSYLKKQKPNINICVGYDSSSFALQKAKESDIQTYLIDISNHDNYFVLKRVDYYLLLEVLEHIPNSEKLLLCACAQSRKGVFISFPNTGYITHRLRMLFGRFPLQWRIFPNEHVRFWTRTDLIWWLSALGITDYVVHNYKGIPILNKIFPGLFAAGFLVYIPKQNVNKGIYE